MVSILFGIILFALSILFYSPAYYGNVLCHTEDVYGQPSYICHKYIEYSDNNVILQRVYDNSTEAVPVQNVSGKIVYVIPPPIGTILFIYKTSIDFMYKLYILSTKGHIPLSYEIKYIYV
jgi:hypothetical protein